MGRVKGTPGGGGPLQNWQIKGGNRAYIFGIDRETGTITIADHSRLDPGTYSLTLMASDSILPSHDQTVTITVHR